MIADTYRNSKIIVRICHPRWNLPPRWPMASDTYRHKWFRTCWRHQMEIFSALLALYVGNSPVTGEFPAQRPVTRGFDVFFDLRLNKPLNKQSWGWWFETLSRSLWRHCNESKGGQLSSSGDITAMSNDCHGVRGWMGGDGGQIAVLR